MSAKKPVPSALQAALDEETRRARDLLRVAEDRYDGKATQDDLDGAAIRYAHAALSRRTVAHQINAHHLTNIARA